jgi:Zn-dependent protease
MFDLTPADLIARLIVLVIAFTVHEFSHAWVADYFGDPTPRMQGRLTLNPLVHLDPLGSLMLLVFGFGWAKPVQVDFYALQRRNRSAPMLVAAAGPASNFVLAFLAALPLRFGFVTPTFQQAALLPSLFDFLSIFILINLLLMLFNLIPIYPLDGEKVLTYFLPPAGQDFMQRIRPYGSILLLVLIFVLPRLRINVLEWLIIGPMRVIYSLLVG